MKRLRRNLSVALLSVALLGGMTACTSKKDTASNGTATQSTSDKKVNAYKDTVASATNLLAADYSSPKLLKDSGTYYLYGVLTAKGGLWTSTDGRDYKYDPKPMFTNKPSYMMSENERFISTFIAKVNGKYLLYFTMNNNGPKPVIGVAISTTDSPQGPYTCSDTPLIDGTKTPHGVIDPQLFSYQGKEYLIYTTNGGPNGIWAQELSSDGLSRVGEPQELLLPTDVKDATTTKNVSRVESPYLMEAPDGKLVLFYSANWAADNNYFTGYAVGDDMSSLFKNGGPILTSGNTKLDGPGEESVFADNGKYYLVYNAWEGPHTHEFQIIDGGKGRYVYQSEFTWQDGHIPVPN